MKILLFSFLFVFFSLGISAQVVDTGSAPNTGTGDPIRTAFKKINAEFKKYADDSSKWIHFADSLTKIATNYQLSLKVDKTTTVNGHELSGNISVTLSDLSVTASSTELNVLDNIPGTLTSTELGYSDGVTSAIQTQINAKATTTNITEAIDTLAIGLTESTKTTGSDSVWVVENDSAKFKVIDLDALADTNYVVSHSGGFAAASIRDSIVLLKLQIEDIYRLLAGLGVDTSSKPPSGYYVDQTGGDDDNDGRSAALAWKTIAKVNATTFTPGDNIFFKRGEEWREQLTIDQSGTAGNPITFSAYGTGRKPIINAADDISGWADVYNSVNANIWGTVDPSESAHFANVIIDDSLYTEVGSLAAINSPRKFWVKTASTPDSIFVWSFADPDTRIAEVASRDYAIYSQNISYINISYMDVRNAGRDGIRHLATSHRHCYSNIDSVFAYRNRLSGIWFEKNGSGTVTNTVATYNGFGITGWVECDNMLISHCYTAHSILNNIGSGGDGAWSDATGFQFYCSSNVIVEYSESEADPIGIFLDNYDAYSEVTNDAFVMTARYNNIHDAPIGNDMVFGIGVTSVAAGGQVSVYYNLFKNCTNNTYGSINLEGTYTGTVNLYNNTVIVDGSREDRACVSITHPLNTTFKNNIYYYNGIYSGENYNVAFITTENAVFTADYNQYYEFNAVGTRFLYYISTVYSVLATWQAVISQDAHSALGNPLFTNAASDYSLQAGSPCVNTGVSIPGVTVTDILGNPINGTPDKGCYERQ